jgi:hypothetical protein
MILGVGALAVIQIALVVSSVMHEKQQAATHQAQPAPVPAK